MAFLFEVSWEVCNKVGGIHTVVRTKASQAVAKYHNHYYLLGPLLDRNPEFEESGDTWAVKLKCALEGRGLHCRLGHWDIPGRPRAVLVAFRDRYDIGKLLYSYWEDFKLESHTGQWDYIEPVLFSTACGEVIETIYRTTGRKGERGVAHFHEWMMGGGLLYLKSYLPEIGTVFTTHATMLGRAMCGSGRDIYSELASIDPYREAFTHSVAAKHSMESVCARAADVFTTVSDVTADEAAALLLKRPAVVNNGINIADLPDYAAGRSHPAATRQFLHGFAERFLARTLPPKTRFFAASGRYEYGNKGYDIFLESLAALERELRQDPAAPPVVALFLIAAGHLGARDDVQARVLRGAACDPNQAGIATHRLYNEEWDPLVWNARRFGLVNNDGNRCYVIICPAYLDGADGIFNRPYEDLLAACDLGVFPSYYEPWGYTPLESIALAVPTVTTDLAGFGRWVMDTAGEVKSGVTVIPRRGRSREEAIVRLTRVLNDFARLPEQELEKLRKQARNTACKADWELFYPGYLQAYRDALEQAARRTTGQRKLFYALAQAGLN